MIWLRFLPPAFLCLHLHLAPSLKNPKESLASKSLAQNVEGAKRARAIVGVRVHEKSQQSH